MPEYSFSCPNCGNFTVEHGMSEDHPKTCPTCGAKISRRFSIATIHYKGSGFFSTDRKLFEPTEDQKIEAKLDRVLAGKSEN